MKYELITTCIEKNQIWEISGCEAGEPQYSRQINVYPDKSEQVIRGFGGAFTEAAGYVLAGLPEEKRCEVMDWYFSEDGLRYNLCRTHMNSCDFALGNWTAISDPTDKELKSFTLENDEKYILPMIRMARERAKNDLRLLLSPWSPPAFMKTNGNMNFGGKLLPEFADMWAACIARYVKEYRAMGFDVTMVSVQNEPEAVQTWDSCVYTAEDEADFVRDHLAPAMKQAGVDDTGIMVWDHNKDAVWRRAITTLGDKKATDEISYVGFHWYGGDHFEAVRMVRDAFPDKELYFTEGCVEYSRFAETDRVRKAEMYAHEYIGDANAGTSGFIDWNLMLDEKGGPNHVGNFCEAPVMMNENGEIERHLIYYYIGHFSRYIKNGARLVRSSSFGSEGEAAAFVNPDGTRVVVILNRTDNDMPVSLTEGDTACNFTMSPHSIVTCRYTA